MPVREEGIDLASMPGSSTFNDDHVTPPIVTVSGLRDGECVGLATFIGDVDARASGCDAAVSLDSDYDTRFRHTHRAPVVRRGGRHAGEVGGIRIG